MQSVHDGLCLRRAITFQQIAFRLLIVSRRSSSKVEIGHHHMHMGRVRERKSIFGDAMADVGRCCALKIFTSPE